MTDFNTVAATVGKDIASFRESAVTTENRGDRTSRSLLASLLGGLYTVELATAAIITAFGDPKRANGKPVDSLRQLDAFKGGGAVRKVAETCFKLFANVDIDAPRTVSSDVEGEADRTVGAGVIRPLIISFVLQSDGAPKSLHALQAEVSKALAAHAKAISPDNAKAKAETDAESADATATAAPSNAFDPKAAIDLLAVYFSAMTVEQAEAIGPHVSGLMAAYDNRINALTDSGEADVAVNG